MPADVDNFELSEDGGLPAFPEQEEDTSSEETITQPFDPTKIRIETKQLSLDSLISRMKNNEIKLQPDFQRNEVWREGARSRLIESILVRIPLPAFYMDATDDEKWLVVDGQQRLSTLRGFVIDKSLRLRGLEFLHDFDGFGYDDLPRAFQRRIVETNVTVYLIEKGTPSALKINVFKRINTGGMPLSPQEIRHALNGAPATVLLKELAESDQFRQATLGGVSSERMADREYVVRFFAFMLTEPDTYNAPEFDSFLSETMAAINKLPVPEIDHLRHRFLRAMKIAHSILGDHAFRKRYNTSPAERRKMVNKALFEAWSVNLEALSDTDVDKLAARTSVLWTKFVELMNERKFDQAVSQGTGDVQRVRLRFGAIRRIIEETLA